MSTSRPEPRFHRRGPLLFSTALLTAGMSASALAVDGGRGGTERSWYMHTGGVSHHLQQTRAEGRQWNQVHPGIGFETRQHGRDDGWSTRQGFGLMQDSRGFWGGYAGAGYLHRWRVGRSSSFSAGAGAYAFYRSVSWSGERALVPAILPTASLDLFDHSVGMNLVAIPPVRAFGGETVPSLMLQFTVRLR